MYLVMVHTPLPSTRPVFEDEVSPEPPPLMTLVVATALAHDIHLLAYDWFVQRHNQTVVGAAARANGICRVSSQERLGSPLKNEK
jgi:hypothetical protein